MILILLIYNIFFNIGNKSLKVKLILLHKTDIHKYYN